MARFNVDNEKHNFQFLNLLSFFFWEHSHKFNFQTATIIFQINSYSEIRT